MADLFTVSAKIELDISSFHQQMQQAISDAQALTNELELSGTITLDSSAFTSGLSDAESALDGFGNRTAEADADLNTSDFDTNMEGAEGDLSSLDNASAEADAGLDTSDFDTNLGDAESDLSGFDSESAEADASLDTSDFDTNIGDAEGDLSSFDSESVEADIGLDTTDFDSGVTDVTEGMDNVENSAGDMQEALDGDGKEGGIFNGFVVGAAAAVAAVGAIANAIGDVIWDAAQLGDTVVEQSHILGISTDAYQKWDFVLGQNGSSIGTLRQIMRNFTTQLDSDNADFEHSLNTLARATGDTELYMSRFAKLNPEQQFEKVIKGLRAVKGTMTDSEFNALAKTLLGPKAFMEFGNIFDMTDAEYAAALESGEYYATSEEIMESAGGLADKFAEVTNAWQNFVTNFIGVEGFDTITGFIQNIIDLINSLTDAVTNDISLWGWITGVDDGGVRRVEAVGEQYNQDLAMASVNADRANVLVGILADLEKEMGPLAKDTDTWKAAMAELESIYPGITDVINDNNGSFLTGAQNIRDYIAAQKELAIVEAKQKALQNYSDAYTTELGKLYEYQAQQYAARSEAEAIARKLGYTGDKSLFAFGSTQQEYTGEYENFNVSDFLDWAWNLNELNLQGAVGLTEEQRSALKLGRIADLDQAYGKATANVRNQQEAVDAALKAYEDMATLIETTLSTAMTDAGDSTTTLGTAAESAATELDKIHFRPLAHNANGLWNVPYDGFTSQLHQGEAVLTRIEAERWRNGQGGGGYIDAAATLNIGTFNSYGASDEKTLVAALVSEQRNQLRAVGEKV